MKPTCIVLCGGKERRFGRSKSDACVGGITVMQRTLNTLQELSDQFVFVTSPEKRDLPLISGMNVVTDAFPGKGPLGGIYTGLLHAESDYSVVVACDMPFLNAKVLSHMLELADSHDAVVPRVHRGMIEPLHAVYSKHCAPAFKAALEIDQLPIWQVLNQLNVKYLEREDYLRYDPLMISFFNINFPEDLDKANRIARQLEGAGNMTVSVKLHQYFQEMTGGKEFVEAEGRTVAQLISNLESAYPGMKGHLVDKRGKLQGFIEVFVNSSVVYPEETGMELKDGDEVEILMIVAGG